KGYSLYVESVGASGNDWAEILRNERRNFTFITRNFLPSYLFTIHSAMVARSVAEYRSLKRTQSAFLYWRLTEEWAEVLHDWVIPTGQLSTTPTFYDITDPLIESPPSNIFLPLLRKAIGLSEKAIHAQITATAYGE
ncbi:hypothetical protein BDQ12DRAFT_603191, partial [Crucibulum laeve]